MVSDGGPPDRADSDRAQRAAALFKRWLEERGDFEALCREQRELEPELRRLRQAREILEQAGLAGGEATSFAKRLKEQHGSGLEPHVSLHEEAGQPGEPPTSQLFERLREHATDSSRYRLKGEIARGGMGAILEIWDEDLRRNLAMKVILGKAETASTGLTPPVDRRLLARFLEEAQVTGQLDHPGIVPVHELGLDSSGRVYFTMKLVRGRDLKAIFDLVFSGTEGWNETRALGVLLKVCEAMAYAHRKGVIHRDLKPANVMVGSFGEVYVMDWGLARVLGQKDSHDLRLAPEGGTSSLKTERREERADTPDSPLFTMDGDVVGTPSYMPPEQARGEIERLSARSDVYSIGAILYHLLARRIPYCPPGARVTNRAVLGMVLHGPPPPIEGIRDDVPAELVAICEKAMARETGERYASTLELAEDLQAYLEGRVVRAHQTGAWAEARKWVQRNKPLGASLAAAVLLLVAGLATSLVFKSRADERAADLQAANTTIETRNAELQERERAARQSLYVAAVTGAQSAIRLNEPANVRRLLDSAPEEMRNWEWGYLDAVSDTSLLVLDGYYAAFSRDGAQVVTAAEDHTARVWDAATGRDFARLEGHTALVRFAAFSPDGTRIVTVSEDDTVRVWDTATGKEVARIEERFSFVHSTAFSPDGVRIVTASDDQTARVWDSGTGQELARLVGHTGQVASATFSPDGSRIVTASEDNTARVWDAATGLELAQLEGHRNKVWSAAFSQDGEHVVTASLDSTALVWDAATGKELVRLEGHTSSVDSANFSPDDAHIVTASRDETARVWDAITGKELARIEGRLGSVYTAAFSPDGERIVTASGRTAREWDAATGQELARLNGHLSFVTSAAFSPDGMRIVTASSDDTVRVWEAVKRQELARFERHSDSALSVTFGKHGARVVTAQYDRTAFVWDPATGNEFSRLEGHTGLVRSATFSPDGVRIVTGSGDQTARVWDAATGKEIFRLEGHTSPVAHAAFSPDGSRILTASWGHGTNTTWDRTARVWDAATGEELAGLEGHTDQLVFATFSLDGARIVTASKDRTARVWDTATGSECARLEGHTAYLNSVAFSPDGARIISTTSDMTALVWEAATGREIFRLDGHRSTVSSAAFSPDGSLIVTASFDGTARVWDAATGRERARLEGHTAWVESTVFSPDGSRVLTASGDKTARVWDATTGQELARLEGHTEPLVLAGFSPDGLLIVTAARDGTVLVWDSVAYRIRYAERQALLAAQPAAERVLAERLSRSADLVELGAQIRNDNAIESIVRLAALDLLSKRCLAGHTAASSLEGMHAEATWLSRMLGLQPWPSESEVNAALGPETDLSTDAKVLNAVTWPLVDPDAPPVFGKEIRALLLARRAVASADAEQMNECRTALARALYRLGRFDEALAEQRTALAEAPAESQAKYQEHLTRLESDIAGWRDESGNLRRAEWTAKLDALTREIEELEQDPYVRLWLGKGH